MSGDETVAKAKSEVKRTFGNIITLHSVFNEIYLGSRREMKELTTINSWTDLIKRFCWDKHQESPNDSNNSQIENILRV